MAALCDAWRAGGAPGGATPRCPPLTAHSGLKMAAAATEPMNPPAKKYGSVVITLENVLLPPEKLSPSPSQQDGLDADIEMDLRILGCELIQTGGILLRLPQVSLAPRDFLGRAGPGAVLSVLCWAGRGWRGRGSTRGGHMGQSYLCPGPHACIRAERPPAPPRPVPGFVSYGGKVS